jgi:hypothetical protein
MENRVPDVPKGDRELLDGAWLQQFLLLVPIAIAGTQDAAGLIQAD